MLDISNGAIGFSNEAIEFSNGAIGFSNGAIENAGVRNRKYRRAD